MSHARANLPTDRLSWLLTVLFFGTLWGATEAFLGGLLHRLLPATMPGRIMLVVALFILGYAARKTDRPALPLAMALVAAPLKLLAAPAYGLPVRAPEVMNPALAILAQGGVFTLFIWALGRQSSRDWRLGAAAALAGAFWAMPYALLVRWPGLAL